MEIHFSEYDVRDLLSKVTVFEPTIGSYQFFTVNEQFRYVVKLSNGTIYFTPEELIANREQGISKEQLILAASRFSKTVAGPQRRRDSAIPDAYADALGTSGPNTNRSKMILLSAGIIVALGVAGATVLLMRGPETDAPVYKPANSADTIQQPIEQQE